MGSILPPSVRCASRLAIMMSAIVFVFDQQALGDDGAPEIGTAITIKREVVATLGDEAAECIARSTWRRELMVRRN